MDGGQVGLLDYALTVPGNAAVAHYAFDCDGAHLASWKNTSVIANTTNTR
jgi:hypothetical protein